MVKGLGFIELLFEKRRLELEESELENVDILVSSLKDGMNQKGMHLKSFRELNGELFEDTRKLVDDFTGIKPANNIGFYDMDEFIKRNIVSIGAQSLPTFLRQTFIDLAIAYKNRDSELWHLMAKHQPIDFMTLAIPATSYINSLEECGASYTHLEKEILTNNTLLEKIFYGIFRHYLMQHGPRIEDIMKQGNSALLGIYKHFMIEELIHSTQTSKRDIVVSQELNVLQRLFIEEIAKLTERDLLKFIPKEAEWAFPDYFSKVVHVASIFDDYTKILEQISSAYGMSLEIPQKRYVATSQLIKRLPENARRILPRLIHARREFVVCNSLSEGGSEFGKVEILKNDTDYKQIADIEESVKNIDRPSGVAQWTFDALETSYTAPKELGKSFVQFVYTQLGKRTFSIIYEQIPTFEEFLNPRNYLQRLSRK